MQTQRIHSSGIFLDFFWLLALAKPFFKELYFATIFVLEWWQYHERRWYSKRGRICREMRPTVNFWRLLSRVVRKTCPGNIYATSSMLFSTKIHQHRKSRTVWIIQQMWIVKDSFITQERNEHFKLGQMDIIFLLISRGLLYAKWMWPVATSLQVAYKVLKGWKVFFGQL